MSRAFVDEDASASNEAEAPEIKIPIPPGSRNYLTPEGAEALSRELHELTAEARPRAQAELAALTGPGSSADPDALAAIRRRLGSIDRRTAYLDAMAGLAEVMPPPPEEGRDRVKFGARVRVREAGGQGWGAAGGEEKEYRIVGIDEADPERGLIGWPSPVARALMGRRAGDKAKVKLPAGSRELLVLSVEYL
jgi:transcription elongation factor GreB